MVSVIFEMFISAFVEIFWNTDFARQIFATFIGALFGIPAGLFIDRWTARKRARTESGQLSEAVKETLRSNVEILDRLSTSLKAPGDSSTPHYEADLTILRATASRKYEVLDIEICAAIDRASYALETLNERLRGLREAGRLVGQPLVSPTWYIKTKSITLGEIPDVKREVNAAIKSLGYSPAPV